MYSVVKWFNNFLYKNNKVNIETIVENKELEIKKCEILENTELREKKMDIIKTIFDLKILTASQVKIFRSLSRKSLLELLNAFNVNHKIILEVLNKDSNNESSNKYQEK
jgi:hypothetical protein